MARMSWWKQSQVFGVRMRARYRSQERISPVGMSVHGVNMALVMCQAIDRSTALCWDFRFQIILFSRVTTIVPLLAACNEKTRQLRAGRRKKSKSLISALLPPE